jgi:hypothetical protein
MSHLHVATACHFLIVTFMVVWVMQAQAGRSGGFSRRLDPRDHATYGGSAPQDMLSDPYLDAHLIQEMP